MSEPRMSAQQCLAAAGWQPDREIDISRFLAALRADGYDPPPVVAEFLRRFGGLRLDYANFRDPTRPDHCHFRADLAASNIYPEQVKGWSELAGRQLCPFGEAFDDHMTLLMSDRGEVYAGIEDSLYSVAASGEAAIEALCGGQELRPVTA